MHLLSWNLQGNPHARTALFDYLRNLQEPEVVVCLQEWVLYNEKNRPTHADIEREIAHNLGSNFDVAASNIHRNVALVTLISSTLKSTPRQSQPNRAVVCEISQDNLISHPRWPSALPLTIVNVHQVSRLNQKTLYEREEIISNFKMQLIPLLTKPHRRIILAGDWNAEPHEPEIWYRLRLNASRERYHPPRKTKSVEVWPSLYNPSWSLLLDRIDSKSCPIGTYYFQPETEARGCWKVYDQVLLSDDLSRNWGVGWNLSILSQLSKHHLIDGQPPDTVLSDHVPIQFQFSP